MKQTRMPLAGIALFAAAKFIVHLLINHRYGFHRDELQTLADARHLDWGFVAYPPLTPLIGRLSLELFGLSLTAVRGFAALAQVVVLFLAVAMVRRFGGDARAQWLAALLVAISPISLAASSLFQYVSFDMLWWVAIAFGLIARIQSNDPRWWPFIGSMIGLAVQTKYTIAFLVAGLVLAVLLTQLRRDLASGWLWLGALVATLIAAPNLLWQWKHGLISLEFLHHIHERDVRIGRTNNFLIEQLYLASSIASIPVWMAGLWTLMRGRLREYRAVAILLIVPFVLFIVAQGRGYYSAPLFIPLIAAGSVVAAERLATLRLAAQRTAIATAIVLIVLGSGIAIVATPIAPEGSALWKKSLQLNGDFREEYGWQELTDEVARVWGTLSPQERERTAIFCDNYGEAGALELFGPARGLPQPISGTNSFWLRGYRDDTRRDAIVLGSDREDLDSLCTSVAIVGTLTNRLGIENEESSDHREIYHCRGMKKRWSEIWPETKSFG